VYDDETRIAAKQLWLQGGKTDAEIAEAVGIARADTVRDWRTRENWESDKAMIASIVAETVKTQRANRQREAAERLAKMAEAFMRLIARAMSNPALRVAEIKALTIATSKARELERIAFEADESLQPPNAAPRRYEWVLAHRPEEEEVLRKYREGRLIEAPGSPPSTPARRAPSAEAPKITP
jgi:transposase-like protein